MSFNINNLARNITKFLNFAPNLITNDLTVTVYGGYQAAISGCKKILIYDDNLLVVSDYEKQLKIIGTNIVLSEMSQDELVVTGKINVIEFENHRR